jgi:Flp pilus assembly protein CpaB
VTALLDRPARTGPDPDGTRPPVRLPASSRTRRPVLVAGSALLVFASIAIFASLYSSSNHRTEVLVVTRTIQQGQVITGADLGRAAADLSTGVTPIPVAEASQLAGRRAAVTVPVGSLLVPADLSTSMPLAANLSIVGLAVKVGQAPAAGVSAGDEVMIIQTGIPGSPVTGALAASSSTGDSSTSASADPSGAGSGATGILVPEARVYGTAVPPASSSDGVTELVSVEVPRDEAAAVTAAATAGQVGLVLLPPGSGA